VRLRPVTWAALAGSRTTREGTARAIVSPRSLEGQPRDRAGNETELRSTDSDERLRCVPRLVTSMLTIWTS